MEQQNKRRFSLEDDFMKSRENKQLYGFMRCLSTAMPDGDKNWKEYLLVSTFKKNKGIAAKLCGVSTRTIERNLKSLIAAGLVEEGEMESNGKKYACYFFPFDYNGIYKLIDLDLLKFIVNSGNAFSIQTYLYLLNCSTAKDNYEFTLRELCEAFGYPETNQVAKGIIKDCLVSLKNNGIIDYDDEVPVKFMKADGNMQQTKHKILKFVATKAPSKVTTW